MKVLPFKVPKPQHDRLIYQEDYEYVFYNKLHQHQEIQISYIHKGQGTLIVGDSINDYNSGDVIVIGSNLPHVFKSESNPMDKSLMITLFFTEEAFGEGFFMLEELRSIRLFFTKAAYGFKLDRPSKRLQAIFLQLRSASKLRRFIYFLDILRLLTRGKQQPLSSFIYDRQFSDDEGKRMQDIMAFTSENFSNNISLSEVANVANMTKNAFCKYFKRRTNKSYFTFLNEMRIEHASKLLATRSEYAIAEIAELSGFNNMAHFNRLFKRIKGKAPSYFRKDKTL